MAANGSELMSLFTPGAGATCCMSTCTVLLMTAAGATITWLAGVAQNNLYNADIDTASLAGMGAAVTAGLGLGIFVTGVGCCAIASACNSDRHGTAPLLG